MKKMPIGAIRFSSRALIMTENDRNPRGGMPKSGVNGNVGIQNEMKISAHASAPPKRCIRAKR
jgi:hypothetical protein